MLTLDEKILLATPHQQNIINTAFEIIKSYRREHLLLELSMAFEDPNEITIPILLDKSREWVVGISNDFGIEWVDDTDVVTICERLDILREMDLEIEDNESDEVFLSRFFCLIMGTELYYEVSLLADCSRFVEIYENTNHNIDVMDDNITFIRNSMERLKSEFQWTIPDYFRKQEDLVKTNIMIFKKYLDMNEHLTNAKVLFHNLVLVNIWLDDYNEITRDTLYDILEQLQWEVSHLVKNKLKEYITEFVDKWGM